MSRPKRWVAVVLLAIWVPEPSWLLGMIAVADGSHPVSMRWAHGDVDLVLHHHDSAPLVDEHALHAADQTHGDHVVHGMRDGMLAGRAGHVGVWATATVGTLQPWVAPCTVHTTGRVAGFGLSPPGRTVVLRI